jgi:hypothetical protein
VLEHAREEPAQEHESGDAESHRQQAERHRQRNSPAIALRHAPEREIEMHEHGLLAPTVSEEEKHCASDCFSTAVELD